MNIGCVIEVSEKLESSLLERLVTAAYGASRRQPVVLLVPPALRATVDRILDPVVPASGCNVAGVVFKDPETDVDRVVDVSASVSLVVASTDRFRTLLYGRGVGFLSPETGIAALAQEGTAGETPRPTGASPASPRSATSRTDQRAPLA